MHFGRTRKVEFVFGIGLSSGDTEAFALCPTPIFFLSVPSPNKWRKKGHFAEQSGQNWFFDDFLGILHTVMNTVILSFPVFSSYEQTADKTRYKDIFVRCIASLERIQKKNVVPSTVIKRRVNLGKIQHGDIYR